MFTRCTVDKPNKALTEYLLSLGRDKVGLATLFHTGHNYFRKHLSVELFLEKSICRMCRQSEETAQQVISEFNMLGAKRRRLLGASYIKSSEFPDLDKLVLELFRDT